MKRVLLKDIALVTAGQSAPQEESAYGTKGIPFIRAGHLQFLISSCNEDALPKISEENANLSKLKKYPPGAIIFAKSGMSCMKGYVYTLHSTCYVVSHLAVIIPSKEVYSEYLRHYFSFHRPNSLVKDEAYPSISLSEIGNMEIMIYPLDVQYQIITKLNSVEQLIKNRQSQLKKIDELASSRFVEMYAKSVLSEETTIEAITDRVKVGFVGTCEKYYTDDSGIPMVRTGNITDNGIDLSDLKYVTREFHEKNKKSQIHEGDLLIARHGSNGQSNVYYGPEAQCLNAVVVVPNPQKATSVFLSGLINSPFVKQQINRTLVGSTQHVVNTKSIANIVVRIPNIQTQQKYEAFVRQLDKSKVTIRKSIEKLELLYKALLQEYFG